MFTLKKYVNQNSYSDLHIYDDGIKAYVLLMANRRYFSFENEILHSGDALSTKGSLSTKGDALSTKESVEKKLGEEGGPLRWQNIEHSLQPVLEQKSE